MSLSQKLKSIIKKPADKATFGTNPSDPWSAKADINESASLNAYLKSRGINPEFVSTQQKISHAKSTDYLRWKQQHMHEDIKTTPSVASKKKNIAQQAVAAHKEVKSIPGPGFGEAKGSQVTQLTPEETELQEGGFKRIATDREEDARLKKMSALDKFRADAAAREKKHDAIAKNSGGMTSAIDRLEKHLNKEDVTAELKQKLFQQNRRKELQDKGLLAPEKPKNENTLDPQAATEAPKGPGEGVTESQKQRSKSARIIKSIYKRKNMKEETYDWEKDDKTPQKLGKGVKLSKTDPKDSFGEKKPDARIVMSGGKTMTGEKRDTVEIDPLMAKRTTPDDFDKPIGKKDK